MQRLLIANRGEIARRIIRTARRLGIATLAVYSDADAGALHVREADVAVALGGNASADTYLRADKLLEAARATGADAVHPGYGFLSESADFAQAVIDAGLTWVGPPPAAMRLLGNKAAARKLARARGVPCLPGYEGDADGGEPADERLAQEAHRIGFPVMVKAAAGGGGRGMRLVSSQEELLPALRSARSEAAASFGSGQLLLERAVPAARHVEVQVFADAHGRCIHLGERDCSVQRRHQKLIEETPSPAVEPELRERMGACAVALVRAAGYVGAGTVEFLLEEGAGSVEASLSAAGPPPGAKAPVGLEPAALDVLEHLRTGDRGEASRGPRPAGPREPYEVKSVGAIFHFLEVNTRLQVEHPVTEAVTGLDLVEWQLRVARGEPLPLEQDEVRLRGHAIEVRLCAEDATFVPHAGCVLHFDAPAAGGEGLRFDHAIFEGLEVTPWYDAMLGKLVACAPTRAEAIDRLAAALDRLQVLGLPTNRRLLAACLRHPVFRNAAAFTAFLADHGAELQAALAQEERAALFPAAVRALYPRGPSAVLPAPFTRPIRLRHRGESMQLAVCEAAGLPAAGDLHATAVVPLADGRWHVQHGAVDLFFEDLSLAPPAGGGPAAAGDVVRAPFNGRLVAVHARPGQRVVRGQTLLVIESMKLEHALAAPRDGTIASVAVDTGQQVATAQMLVLLDARV